jgi:Zn-dependent protease
MLEGGYWRFATWRGVPLRVHVLTPLGALWFGGLRFAPGVWLGFFVLVLLHEIGHALAVMRYRLRVASIDVLPFGGVCRWSGNATDWERTVIAWGGVAAQAVLLIVTWIVAGVTRAPRFGFFGQLIDTFIVTNLWLIAMNLVPLPPFDGAEAWRIVGYLRERWSARAVDHRAPPTGRQAWASRDSSAPGTEKSAPWRGGETPSSRPDAKISPDEARRIAKAFEDAVRRRS